MPSHEAMWGRFQTFCYRVPDVTTLLSLHSFLLFASSDPGDCCWGVREGPIWEGPTGLQCRMNWHFRILQRGYEAWKFGWFFKTFLPSRNLNVFNMFKRCMEIAWDSMRSCRIILRASHKVCEMCCNTCMKILQHFMMSSPDTVKSWFLKVHGTTAEASMKWNFDK